MFNEGSEVRHFYADPDVSVSAFIVGTGDFYGAFIGDEELFGVGVGGFEEFVVDVPIDFADVVGSMADELEGFWVFFADEVFVAIGGGNDDWAAFAEYLFAGGVVGWNFWAGYVVGFEVCLHFGGDDAVPFLFVAGGGLTVWAVGDFFVGGDGYFLPVVAGLGGGYEGDEIVHDTVGAICCGRESCFGADYSEVASCRLAEPFLAVVIVDGVEDFEEEWGGDGGAAEVRYAFG